MVRRFEPRFQFTSSEDLICFTAKTQILPIVTFLFQFYALDVSLRLRLANSFTL